MATIKERVQAGADLLDKVLPDWWNGKETPTIDLEILEMNSPNMCVLGQCFGEYSAGCEKLAISPWRRSRGPDAEDFGFISGVHNDTGRLTAPWRKEIRYRRNAARRVK